MESQYENAVEPHQESGLVAGGRWLARSVAGTNAIMTLGFLYSAVLSSVALARRPGAVMELAIGSALRVLALGFFLYLTLRALSATNSAVLVIAWHRR